jgi:hypothetical protein
VERALQATFIPSVRENPYERLLAAGNGVSVNTVNSSSPSVLELSGRVWQPVESDADTAWTDHVEWNAGAPIERGTPPAPLTDAFFSQHLPSAQKPDDDDFDHDDNGYSLKLSGSSMGTFFRSPDSPTRENEEDHDEFREYEFYVGAPLDISVRRVAVWLVPEGACFRRRVTIEADVPSTLVIVAGPNGREPGRENRGIWFKDGLRIQDGVQVYLVSSGDISLVHRRGSDNTNNAETVSIVAGGWIEIGGPESSDTFRLGYDADSMDALTEQLLALGALPQVVGGTGTTFAVAPQSWVEITPK